MRISDWSSDVCSSDLDTENTGGPLGADGTGIPRYLQLSTLFRRMIASGEWQVGSQIPTVEELAAEYGVARATVRQALGILNGEGLIERYRAKGTFVTYRQIGRAHV